MEGLIFILPPFFSLLQPDGSLPPLLSMTTAETSRRDRPFGYGLSLFFVLPRSIPLLWHANFRRLHHLIFGGQSFSLSRDFGLMHAESSP